MKPLLITFIFLISFGGAVCAQTDTLVYAQGKIINAATKESVAAKIMYRSEPYGNTVGFLSGSTYSFPFLTTVNTLLLLRHRALLLPNF
ncbi:MAG: hypothetical protein QM734_15630 [Cyclobacteriaceae bacterium]